MIEPCAFDLWVLRLTGLFTFDVVNRRSQLLVDLNAPVTTLGLLVFTPRRNTINTHINRRGQPDLGPIIY